MRAAVYHGVRDIRLEDIEEPSPGPGEVKIQLAHNGVCGSDLHEYFSASTFIPLEPHPQTGASAPVVLGHEFAGTVVEVGEGVTGTGVGTRAALRPTYSCGTCPSCLRGLPNICRVLAFHGLSASGGGLSEFTVMPAGMVHALPDDVSLELGALVEPMAVGHHAVDRSGLTERDTAVIVGAGPIGIGLLFALRARGFTRVLVSETSPERRAAISGLGADEVIDPRQSDLTEAVFRLSDGVGAAAIFDAAGVGAAIEHSIPALAPRGKVVVVGIHEQPFAFNPTSLLLQEVEVIGSIVYDDADYEAVIRNMAAGVYQIDGWVEHAPLSELLTAFDELRAGRKMKILIDL
jgi:(R,R)-butanediol dehydrogenase / meso-butanediol dehydrogenase / diacetyl reductase